MRKINPKPSIVIFSILEKGKKTLNQNNKQMNVIEQSL